MYEPEGRSDAQIEAWLAENERYANAVLANFAARQKQGKTADPRKGSANLLLGRVLDYRGRFMVAKDTGRDDPSLAKREQGIIDARREAEKLASHMTKEQRGGV